MMKYSLLFVAAFGFTTLAASSAKAGDVEKTVYVIENNHPVKHRLFRDREGHWYRVEGGRHVIVEHVSESYPEKYFTREGRPRPGITIDF